MSKLDKLNKLSEMSLKSNDDKPRGLSEEDIKDRLRRAEEISGVERAKASVVKPVEFVSSGVQGEGKSNLNSETEKVRQYTMMSMSETTKQKIDVIISEIGCTIVQLFNAMCDEG